MKQCHIDVYNIVKIQYSDITLDGNYYQKAKKKKAFPKPISALKHKFHWQQPSEMKVSHLRTTTMFKTGIFSRRVCFKTVRPTPTPKYMLQQESHKDKLETSGKMPTRKS